MKPISLFPVKPIKYLFLKATFLLFSCAGVDNPSDDLLITATGKPADGKLDVFLEESIFLMKTLYSNGERVRRPNITVAVDGTILALGDGKLRRSEDGGETWSASQEVPFRQLIVDENSGDILSVLTMGENKKFWRSKDQGKTWEMEHINIKPNDMMRQLGEEAEHPDCIKDGANESGITIRHGEGIRRGRLLYPVRYQPYGSNDREYWADNYNTAIYSDDGGKTWQISDFFPVGWTGEGTLAELSDGRVYYNSRKHNPDTKWRHIA